MSGAKFQLRNSLQQWFDEPLGQLLLAEEQAVLDEMLAGLFGYHLVQIGSPTSRADLVRGSRVGYCFGLERELSLFGDRIRVLASPESLPLETDALDVVLLPHTLEFADDPHAVLRESERVLIPEGHVVICGFNPWSPWGVRKALTLRPDTAPWAGDFLNHRRLKDWLALLGFDVVKERWLFYRPPLRHMDLLRRLQFLERVGSLLWTRTAAVYILLAKKRVATLTPIYPRRRVRRRILAGGMAEPTTRG